MNETTKKKNILDLHFQKYLVIASTSIIIAFTYLIGVAIAVFSKQIILNDLLNMAIVFIISVGVLGICTGLFFNALFHLKNILKVLKEI